MDYTVGRVDVGFDDADPVALGIVKHQVIAMQHGGDRAALYGGQRGASAILLGSGNQLARRVSAGDYMIGKHGRQRALVLRLQQCADSAFGKLVKSGIDRGEDGERALTRECSDKIGGFHRSDERFELVGTSCDLDDRLIVFLAFRNIARRLTGSRGVTLHKNKWLQTTYV